MNCDPDIVIMNKITMLTLPLQLLIFYFYLTSLDLLEPLPVLAESEYANLESHDHIRGNGRIYSCHQPNPSDCV